MMYRKQYDITITLCDEINAYLYSEDDMVPLSSITSDWFTKLTTLRKVYPKNRLLKHLLASAWGHLSQRNVLYKTLKQIEEEGLQISRFDGFDYKILEKNVDNPDNEHYILLNTKSPYKHNICLKSWVTAIARNMTISVVLTNIDNAIRIQTDCITFKNYSYEFEDSNIGRQNNRGYEIS